MAVGLDVLGERVELGSADFLHAFFSTASVRLEYGRWGSRFPTVMGPLYQGKLPTDQVVPARHELRRIRAELGDFQPRHVVWDIEDRAAQPPWGDEVAPGVTNLAEYFVTGDGEDLFDALDEQLAYAEGQGVGAEIA